MSATPPAPAPVADIFVPAREFRDPQWDVAENERLWPKVWQMACREAEITAPGQFIRYDILDESILIVRTGDGPDELSAFYNVCQHRGRRLREEKRGALGVTFACRFHGWQFDRKGDLHKAYMEQDWDDCPQFDRTRLSIPKVRLARWGGWVWINMDPDAEPLDSWLGQVKDVLAPFHLGELRPKWWKTIFAPVNWKVVVEAFNEGYHSGSTHTCGINYWGLRSPTAVAGNHAAFFSEAAGFTEYKDTGNKWVKPKNFIENMWANNRHIFRTLGAMTLEPGMAASERLLELPGDTEPMAVLQTLFDFTRDEIENSGAKFPETMTLEKLFAAGTDWHIFPNSIVLPTLDGALWYRVRPNPKDRDACVFDIWSFGRYAPGAEPVIENELYNGFEEFAGQCEFLEEDFANLEAVNLGMKSNGFSGAFLNPLQEGTISNFHRMLRKYAD
jgi:phenylpropionate dioxygenase-like ring-hydroxylating dioxygenase large terminal subunit